MSKLLRYGCLIAALLGSFNSYADDVQISHAWVRATAPGQETASVDMTIASKFTAALIDVSSPASNSATLHSMTNENNMMRMREVPSIPLPADKAINLREAGFHIMLEGLKTQLRENDTLPLTLHIQTKQKEITIDIQAQVVSPTATGAISNGATHHHNHSQH